MVTVSPGLTSTVVPVSEPSVPMLRSMLPGTRFRPPSGEPAPPRSSLPEISLPLRSLVFASASKDEPSTIPVVGGSWVV